MESRQNFTDQKFHNSIKDCSFWVTKNELILIYF